MAITYDRLIMDHTSGVHLGNFDVDEGIFTAGTPGDILWLYFSSLYSIFLGHWIFWYILSFDSIMEHILCDDTTGVYSVDFSSSVTYNTLNDYIEVSHRIL